MNKKLITLFTALSISALTVGIVSIVRGNNNSFAKTAAAEKNVSLTSISGLDFLADETDFLIDGDISTGTETYVSTYISGTNCHYNEDNSKFLSVTGGTWENNSKLEITLGIRGLISFEIRGQVTDPSGFNSYYISYVSNPDNSLDSGAGKIDPISMNTIYKDEVSVFYTESVTFIFEYIGTVSITSINLTMSCETN